MNKSRCWFVVSSCTDVKHTMAFWLSSERVAAWSGETQALGSEVYRVKHFFVRAGAQVVQVVIIVTLRLACTNLDIAWVLQACV